MGNIIKSDSNGVIRKLQQKLESIGSEKNHQIEAVQQSSLWMKSTIWTLVCTAAFGIGWLAIAKTEEVIIVTGKLEPISAVNELKVPIGGVVDQVLVKEGQRVKKGDVLLKLDTESSKTKKDSLDENLLYKKRQLELKMEELSRYLKLNNTEQRVLQENLLLQKEILKRFKSLQIQGAGSEMQVLQQKDKIQQIQGDIDKKIDDRERVRAQVNQQIEELKAESSNLDSQITDQNVTLKYQLIRSPINGIIFELKPTSAGFVATNSEPILKLVPIDKLQANIDIPSSDIGFVKVGQVVDINIDSFPSNDFGILNGTIESIGSDALPPDTEKRTNENSYSAIVKLVTQQLELKNGKNLDLQVGMSLSANIKLRSVTYLQLLLGSFRDKADSLRSR